MIEIRDQQLRLLVLAHLIRELQKSAEESRPAPPGLTEEQFEELRALSTDDLVRLSEMQEPRVAVQIDAGSFEHGLRQVDYIGKRSQADRALHPPRRHLRACSPSSSASRRPT